MLQTDVYQRLSEDLHEVQKMLVSLRQRVIAGSEGSLRLTQSR